MCFPFFPFLYTLLKIILNHFHIVWQMCQDCHEILTSILSGLKITLYAWK